jgi:hypothetical protein
MTVMAESRGVCNKKNGFKYIFFDTRLRCATTPRQADLSKKMGLVLGDWGVNLFPIVECRLSILIADSAEGADL